MASKGSRASQAKLRKKYRRGRYARFSGATTKFAVRIEQRMLREGDVGEDGKPVRFGSIEEQETKVRIKDVHIFVGPVSLTTQVVNGSKSSVNSERMQSYFANVRKKDDPLTVAEVFGITDSRYQKVWDETPSINRINLYSNELGRLDMYWCESHYFFVEVDKIEAIIKRSRQYGSPQRAKDAAKNDDIRWVEFIPIRK